jgi:DNA-binding HxlR family transcriptional regulator
VDKLTNHKFNFSFDHNPYSYAIKVFCNRWKPLIIHAIKVDNSTRYNKFLKNLPITEKVLANNLRELEEDGVISRKVYYEVPLRVEYSLTELGKSVCPILEALYAWGREEMLRKNIKVDEVGEMWHGYLPMDEKLFCDN